MARHLMRHPMWDWDKLPALWDEDWFASDSSSGLEVSEDDKSVIVKAAVPGIASKDVDVSYEKGVLTIRGEREEKEEDKKKKFYRRSKSAYSYQVAVPGNIDADVEPDATVKQGEVVIKFAKTKEAQPKKIKIKEE